MSTLPFPLPYAVTTTMRRRVRAGCAASRIAMRRSDARLSLCSAATERLRLQVRTDWAAFPHRADDAVSAGTGKEAGGAGAASG